MAENQTGEKTEEATPRRKQEARKKGTVTKSQEVNGAMAMLVLAFVLPPMVKNFGSSLIEIFRTSFASIPRDITPESMGGFVTSIGKPLLIAGLPVFAILMVVGVAVNFAQVGFVLSAESMKPTAEKINPVAGLKRMFSKRSVMEGLKAMAKLSLFGWIAYAAVKEQWDSLPGLSAMPPAGAAAFIGLLIHKILIRVAITWAVIAIVDYMFQRHQTNEQIKMTKNELKREMKEQEGSPEVKGAMMQKRRQLLKGGMAKAVRDADVLITNPTHYAIAIKYQRNSMHAPMVLAKGQDHLALKMRELAKDAGIPRVENVPLARALYKQCEPGDFVPRELFGAVAEVLAYVYKSTKRAKSSGNSRRQPA